MQKETLTLCALLGMTACGNANSPDAGVPMDASVLADASMSDAAPRDADVRDGGGSDASRDAAVADAGTDLWRGMVIAQQLRTTTGDVTALNAVFQTGGEVAGSPFLSCSEVMREGSCAWLHCAGPPDASEEIDQVELETQAGVQPITMRAPGVFGESLDTRLFAAGEPLAAVGSLSGTERFRIGVTAPAVLEGAVIPTMAERGVPLDVTWDAPLTGEVRLVISLPTVGDSVVCNVDGVDGFIDVPMSFAEMLPVGARLPVLLTTLVTGNATVGDSGSVLLQVSDGITGSILLRD